MGFYRAEMDVQKRWFVEGNYLDSCAFIKQLIEHLALLTNQPVTDDSRDDDEIDEASHEGHFVHNR